MPAWPVFSFEVFQCAAGCLAFSANAAISAASSIIIVGVVLPSRQGRSRATDGVLRLGLSDSAIRYGNTIFGELGRCVTATVSQLLTRSAPVCAGRGGVASWQ